jgi:hypothetical protein
MNSKISRNQVAKKAMEKRVLVAAGQVSALIPTGEIQDFERPDFSIETATGLVGIEVTELMPAPTGDFFSSPLAEKSWHEKLMKAAEQEFSGLHGAVPVGVSAYFWRTESGKYDMPTMARGLADFVLTHRAQAKPVVTFSRRANLPEGFGVITITEFYEPWHGLETVTLTLHQIHQRLSDRIRAKNELFPIYRANLPNAPIYLLIFSCIEISRGVPIVHGIEEWTFPFDFDRVFFFAGLDCQVVELRKNQSATYQINHA